MTAEDSMEIDIIIKVRVSSSEPLDRITEQRLEKEAVSVVTDCLAKEKSVELLEASLLGFKHCDWVFEDGMPVDCGLPESVRLHTDGSWSYPYGADPLHPEDEGGDFDSLVRFVEQQEAS
jgi:hypothetical protein